MLEIPTGFALGMTDLQFVRITDLLIQADTLFLYYTMFPNLPQQLKI